MWHASSIILGLLILSSSVFAGKINLDSRMDFESFSANEAAAKPAYSVFKINRLKVDFQGILGELNAYRLRIDPSKVGDSESTVSKRQGVSSHVDFAFLSHKLCDDWTVSMGKIITNMGGTEGMNNPGDIYLRSVVGDETAKVYWPTGIQFQGKLGDHTLNINGANISEDVYDNNTSKNLSNTSSLFGFTYMGKFLEGTILPNLSYHTEDFKNTSYVKSTKNYISVGSKFLVSDFEIELDYLNNNRKYDPQSSQIIDSVSMLGLVRYKLETSSVHLKYENSVVKTATNATDTTKETYAGMTLAYEFKPSKDENWRAHIAGTQRDIKPETGDTKTEKKVFVGMRLLADFLK